MINIGKTIANKLKELRSERNLSQEELSDIVGISRNYISLIETCQTNITVVKLCQIAEKLGLPIEYFLR